MPIYLYPLNSLEDLQAALDQGCNQATLFDAMPERGQQAVLTQVDGSELLGVVPYAQDYLSLMNFALLYEINEVDPCESKSK